MSATFGTRMTEIEPKQPGFDVQYDHEMAALDRDDDGRRIVKTKDTKAGRERALSAALGLQRNVRPF